MPDNKLADMSMDFAVAILKLCDAIHGHYSLRNQLERSATSIGANIREAKYAHSKADLHRHCQMQSCTTPPNRQYVRSSGRCNRRTQNTRC